PSSVLLLKTRGSLIAPQPRISVRYPGLWGNRLPARAVPAVPDKRPGERRGLSCPRRLSSWRWPKARAPASPSQWEPRETARGAVPVATDPAPLAVKSANALGAPVRLARRTSSPWRPAQGPGQSEAASGHIG